MSPLKVACFMSGSGTNARKIVELQEKLSGKVFQVALIFSDTMDESRCNANAIGAEYGIPVVIRDLADYYSARGHSTKKDMGIREQYDAETAVLLGQHGIQLVALCGYMSIVTAPIYENFLTINVHPGDLTIMEAGRRVYAGCMGAGCVKKAILRKDREVRSTVHVVNGELDGGAVIAVSSPVKLDYSGISDVDSAAHRYLDELKKRGDWVVYPDAIKAIAEGRIVISNGKVHVRG